MNSMLEAIEKEQAKINGMIASFKAVNGVFPITIQAPNLRPGEKWAGLLIGADGITKHHKILLPEIYVGKSDWKLVMEWAASIGGELPDRVEGALLFNQLKDEFEPEAYWLRETHASNESCAWYQDFSSGTQNFYLKDHELRARAVRSELVI